MGVLGYSTVAGSNTGALSGVGSLAEGVMPIKQVNDAIRQQLADVAQLYSDVVTGITTTGTSSAYVVATASGHSSYNNQMAFRLRFHADCAGGATTVNVNVLGTKALKVFDATGARDPVAGEIKADMAYDCVYIAALNCMVVTAHTLNLASITAALAGKQPLDATLTALAGLDATAGMLVQTAADTFERRSMVSADGSVTIANPAGVAGDIDLSVSQKWSLVATGALTGATVDITSGLAGANEVMIVRDGAIASGSETHQLRVGNSGGFLTGSIYLDYTGTNTFARLSNGAAGERNGVLIISRWSETTGIKPCSGEQYASNLPLTAIKTATALDRIRIFCSGAGAYTAGTYYIYRR